MDRNGVAVGHMHVISYYIFSSTLPLQVHKTGWHPKSDDIITILFTDGKLPLGFPEIQQYPELKAVERDRNAIMQCQATG